MTKANTVTVVTYFERNGLVGVPDTEVYNTLSDAMFGILNEADSTVTFERWDVDLCGTTARDEDGNIYFIRMRPISGRS